MIVNIYFGDEPSTNLTTFVLDPVSFPTDYCFNHTYVTAGTYETLVVLSNNRSSANYTKTIDVDSLFSCNLTLNHSEYQVTQGIITFQAPGATRLVFTLSLGNGIVLAEAPTDGISCFDPGVGEKSWNWTYNSTGIYDIQVNASNSHDSCSVKGVLGVNERIQNLTINSTGNTNLTDPTFFTWTILAGSNVVCEHRYGDKLVTIHYCESPDPVQEFNHTYADIGYYNCKINCYNYLDYFTFSFDIYVQIPIIEFAFNETMYLLRYGGPLDLGFSMQNGTNVTVFSSVNGKNATQAYDFGDLVGHVTLDTYPAGLSTMETIAFNEVSRVQLSTTLQIEKNVTGLLASYNGQSGETIYFTPADSVQFTLSTEDGTFPKFTLDYGDGTTPNVEVSFGTVENKTEYEIPTGVTLNEGYYMMNFTAENNVSSDSFLIMVGVEYPVTDFTVTYENVSDTSIPVTFGITDASDNTPTSTSVVLSYGVTETDDDNPLVDTSTTFNQPHTFQNFGVFMVTVNVSNNVSSVAKVVVVQVGLPVTGIQLNASQCADTNETVDFLASVDQGSDVTFTFNAKDGICPDYIQQQPTTYDYSQPWNYTFNYSYPVAGTYMARLNASSALNTDEYLLEIKIENSLKGTNFPQPEPQSLTSGNPAEFKFDAEFEPTGATCLFVYGDNQNNPDITMTFTNNQFTHTHSYTAAGTYLLEVSCTNCNTSLNATYNVDADEEISQTSIIISPSAVQVLQTNFSYEFTCEAIVGTRVNYSFFYDNETSVDSKVGEQKTFPYLYAAPTNTTVRCRFNNSVSDISEMNDMIVQHKVDTVVMSTSNPNDCVAVNVPSAINVVHTVTPHPTDPFLSYTTTDGQSGSTYSDSLMTTGSDVLTLTFTDVANQTITLNTSNLFNYQMTTLAFAVQIQIIALTLATASGKLYVAADEETVFYATITGSHANLSITWGDEITDEAHYLDGSLDGQNHDLTHTYNGSTQAGRTVTISATATNCFTDPPFNSNNLAITIQNKVDLDNMIIEYPNPVTASDGSIEFSLSIKDGKPIPTTPQCRIHYTDLQGNTRDIFSAGPANTWPWNKNYNFPVEVQVEVELEISCWNNVSEANHTATLVLEQPIKDLDIAMPPICETKVPCQFNITMTTGSNLNITVSITDGTDPQNLHQSVAVTAIPKEHTFQTQGKYNITVRAFNHINDTSVTRSIETRHTVKNLQIAHPDYVNLKVEGGLLRVVATTGGEVPNGVMMSLAPAGGSQRKRRAIPAGLTFVPAEWVGTSTNVTFTLQAEAAYDMRLFIHNDVTQMEDTFTVHGEYPIINLEVDIMDRNDQPSTDFKLNDVIKVRGRLTGHESTPSNVMYSVQLPNYENSNTFGDWSHVMTSPGDPWACNVTAKNNVSNKTTTKEFVVKADFPLLHLEYNETTIVTRQYFIIVKVARQFLGKDVAVCFRLTFPDPDPEKADDIQYRGENRRDCETKFGTGTNEVNDANFEESEIEIFESSYLLKMNFSFVDVGIRTNCTIFGVMLHRDPMTNEFVAGVNDKTFVQPYHLDVQPIPCSSPVARVLRGATGNNESYPQINLRSTAKTFMLGEFYSITYDCEKTKDTVIDWQLYRVVDGELYATTFPNCPNCRMTAMGFNIEQNKLNYSTYIFNVSITMGTIDLRYDEFSTFVLIYINVSETPLSVSLNTGERVTLGKSITMTS